MNQHKPNCINCQNSDCIIKKNIHLQQVKEFSEQKHNITCKKGQHFILEGAPVHGLFFIRDGKVKVGKTGIYGREQIVRFANNGETIGHRGFAVGQFYKIHAVALVDTQLCNFTLEVLQQMLLSIPKLTYDFMLFYAEELHKSENKVKTLAQMTVREKVIDAFLYINRKFGVQEGYLNVPLSRREIADFAGTTEEQVIRIISALKKEQLITSKGKKLGIPDVALLSKEIAEHNYFLDS